MVILWIIPMDGERFARVVGRRQPAPAGEPPPAETRRAMAEMARYRTRAPKGIFIYESHARANEDRERWIVDAVVELERMRAGRTG